MNLFFCLAVSMTCNLVVQFHGWILVYYVCGVNAKRYAQVSGCKNVQSEFEVKNYMYVCLFERPLRVSKNGIFFFERSSFIPKMLKFLLKN